MGQIKGEAQLSAIYKRLHKELMRRSKQMLVTLSSANARGYSEICNHILHNSWLKNTKTQNTFKETIPLFKDKTGLEIGGPSDVFRTDSWFPVYGYAAAVDNVNFSRRTLWNDFSDGGNVVFRNQILAEGSDLSAIKDRSYDFVLSSHVLEHLSNPLKALVEWNRILRTGGIIVSYVPHRDLTYDHLRPVTSLSHILADYASNIPEGDVRHLNLNEIFDLYDIDLDPGLYTLSDFKDRTSKNKSLRALHQHVFDTQLVLDLYDKVGMEIIIVETSIFYHIIVVGIKRDRSERDFKVNNRSSYPNSVSEWRMKSVFKSEMRFMESE